jgi:hypothetical protein
MGGSKFRLGPSHEDAGEEGSMWHREKENRMKIRNIERRKMATKRLESCCSLRINGGYFVI